MSYSCSFKQIQSWVEEPCWWCLWWCGLALTPVDIMVQWKMSCQLMEELPVAAGRSVATRAMCVNLFPCHFFLSSSPPPPPPNPFYFHLHLFSLSLLNPPSNPLHLDSTPSTYTPPWQITPGGWFVGCQKCSLHWHEGGVSRRRGCSPPPPSRTHTYTHIQYIHTPPPTSHVCVATTECWDVSVEIDILSHKISSD